MASLARLPKEVIDRANEILKVYETNASNKKGSNVMQTSFDFDSEKEDNNNEIINELREVNPLTLTPMEALNKLYEITEKVKKEN